MTSLDYLKALLKTIGVENEDDVFLSLMIEEAQQIFKHITNRTNYSSYQSGVARIAFFNYQKLGDEAKKSYNAGSMSINYNEIKTAMQGYLPLPLIKICGTKVDCEDMDIRIDYTKPLKVHVVNDFPLAENGSLIFNTSDNKFYGASNGKWVDLGVDMKETISPTVDIITSTDSEYILKITDKNGEKITPNLKGANGKDGVNGVDGKDGTNGTDGFSPTIAVNTNTETEYTLKITNKDGVITTPNLKGKDGDTGSSVTSYTTLTDKPSISNVELTGNKTLTDIGVAKVGETGNYTDLIGTPNIPTKLSELTDDKGYITAIPQATTEIGGIRANQKQDTDTVEVRIDGNTGYLYCSGGSGGGDLSGKQDKPIDSNTSYGKNALAKSDANGENTAIGMTSLYNNSTGKGNTAVGMYSLNQNTSGSFNTVIGHDAMRLMVDGNPAQTLTNSSAIGSKSSVSGSNQVQLGDSNTTTYCYGAIQNRSDRRDKADIEKTELGLDFILKLVARKWRWNYRDDYKGKENDGSKKRNRYHQGFIAQEVKGVMDELGVDFGGYQDHSINGGCDVLSLGYEEFIAPIVKAIQEQQQMIESLKSEIEMLKKG